MATKFTQLNGEKLKASLGRKLVPVVDQLRDLHTRFGLRPYRVKLVRTRWTGGGRGQGSEYVVSEQVILPTPLVSDLTAVGEVLSAVGFQEIGSIQVSEISGTLTEEQLRGLADADGNKVDPQDQFFWEIEFLRTDGRESQRRRFQLIAAPMYWSSKFQWVVKLEKQSGDRKRSGDPR